MSRVIVAYNAPARAYIGYVEGEAFRQVEVTDAEIDATAADQQRETWRASEAVREKHAKNVGATFEAQTFAPIAPSHQQVRERIATELATNRLRALGAELDDQLEQAEEPPKPDEPEIPKPPAP
jgi:hypothetical protein